MMRRGGRDQEYTDDAEGRDDLVESAGESDSEIPRSGTDRSQPGSQAASLIRGWALSFLSRSFLIFTIGAGVMLVLMFMLVLERPDDLITIALPPTLAAVLPPRPTRTPTVTPTPEPPPVALLAGHSGGIDPGANCPDGLREVDVTTDVAKRAKGILEASGYRVDILAEFDARLNAKRDYAPRAFLAIHADSCVYYASGYKVARASSSASPLEDDRLVRCVSTAYAAATLLPFHAGSITSDMTQYHGLNEINPRAPGAIIELGFLGSQHDLLKNRRAMLGDAIAAGLNDFLRGDPCKKPDANGQ